VSDFDFLRFLGAGGFGMVLLAKRRETERYYAIKVIDKRIVLSQSQVHTIFREKEVLAMVDHPFIVSLRYAFQTEHHLCLVIDYVEAGNMYTDLMHGPYPLPKTIFYAAQVVLALEYLHSLGILYRDLKPDNILLTGSGTLRLADMGAARGTDPSGLIKGDSSSARKTAKRKEVTRSRRMTITGTHGYRAPEVYERSYGMSADWWNLGILIIEMLTTENPLRGENRKDSENLAKNKEVTLPQSMTDDTRQIVKGLLERDAEQRLGTRRQLSEGVDESMAQAIGRIKAQPFFVDIQWEALLTGEHDVPFQVKPPPPPPEAKHALPTGANPLDFFCEMVDYMKQSKEMRGSWNPDAQEQQVFNQFEFVSTKVFEEELEQLTAQMKEQAANRNAEKGSRRNVGTVLSERSSSERSAGGAK